MALNRLYAIGGKRDASQYSPSQVKAKLATFTDDIKEHYQKMAVGFYTL